MSLLIWIISIFLLLDFKIIDIKIFLCYFIMDNNSYNKNSCKITKDLLLNCVKKSNKLDECVLLKSIYNRYCKKFVINISLK